MTLNLSGPYKFTAGQEGLRTRDGREAWIYSVRDEGNEPIHGAVYNKDTGAWRSTAWRLGGRWWDGGESTADLVPPNRNVYVAMWLFSGLDDVRVQAFDSAEEAEKWMEIPSRHRLAVLGPVNRKPAP